MFEFERVCAICLVGSVVDVFVNCGGRSFGVFAEYLGGSSCWGKEYGFEIIEGKSLYKCGDEAGFTCAGISVYDEYLSVRSVEKKV